jgi:hypothetical protein
MCSRCAWKLKRSKIICTLLKIEWKKNEKFRLMSHVRGGLLPNLEASHMSKHHTCHQWSTTRQQHQPTTTECVARPTTATPPPMMVALWSEHQSVMSTSAGEELSDNRQAGARHWGDVNNTADMRDSMTGQGCKWCPRKKRAHIPPPPPLCFCTRRGLFYVVE